MTTVLLSTDGAIGGYGALIDLNVGRSGHLDISGKPKMERSRSSIGKPEDKELLLISTDGCAFISEMNLRESYYGYLYFLTIHMCNCISTIPLNVCGIYSFIK